MRRVALALCLPLAASAHRGSVTYGHVRVGADAVAYDVEILAPDLAEALGLPRDTTPARAQVEAGRDRLADYVGRRIAILNHGRECAPGASGLAFADKADGFAARLSLRYRCERRPEQIEIRYHLFFEVDPRHESYTTVEVEGTLRQHVFRQGERTFALDRPVSAWDNAADYLLLGVEHIFTGYDHICFLVGLLLVAGVDGRTGERRGLRRGFAYTLTIVTAFTVAHSITLIASAVGAVSLPSRLIESTIALSILYVAVENLLAREPRRRWLLTFGFGLVHGFGFAGVLREIGLPRQGLLLSLLSFNLGVEVGQAAIVAALFPLLHIAAARRAYRPAVLLGGSAAIASLAAFWFVERAFALRLLGGRLG